MAKSATNQLSKLLAALQAERQEHVLAVQQIDKLFAQHGIQPRAARRRGRPPGTTKAKAPTVRRRRRRRRRFATSGPVSILNFVRQAGKGGVPSAKISKHWKSEGRSGEPYITLGQLVRARKLKKQRLKGQRGSQYRIA